MDVSRFKGKYHSASEPVQGVLLLEFNRPPVNAFHDDMWIELRAIVERISASPEARAVVLSSANEKTFTAGLDLTAQTTLNDTDHLDPARKAFKLREHILDFQGAISSLSHCRQPVIAALFGTAVGLAIDIASACDIRLAASNTVFGIFEVNVGLAADIGTLQRFPKIIGNDSKVRELALTGRKFLAGEAKEIGFLSEVVQGGRGEVIAAAVEIAKVIAEKSPVAVVGTKHLLNHSRDHTVDEGLEYTATWNMAMLQSTDTSTAMKAVLKKQTPKFPHLSGSGEAKAKL
ncbi:hypothetical protein CI109_102891 [Kwoniella shandongensis]|uniref:Uncharacterized protein n=1 Tax=Kwoniella shandongensis TaxID=1734106 RepID=A0A5M6C8L0_9TREE|nr:uncharacterized protein CI109_000081 [Kwoniella shandongensis]KAA5531241.1 hypothetical protein CI109_000081 [Kwoniella shandongensis]